MSGDGLVPPLNAPPAGQPLPGVQPGTQNSIVLANIVIIFGPTGAATGLFVYQPGTTPGAGNPPIAWITANTVDPYGNTLQPGVMLAQAASSGKAQGGLIWNSATPGAAEPLLALFPNAGESVGFTGNAPFVLGRVFNNNTLKELLALALGGGSTTGSSPVQFELFSQSVDGSILGHVSFYDWASTNLLIDINASTLITAADPNSANTNESWHAMGAFNANFSHGSPAPAFKLNADDTVSFAGEVTVVSGTTSGTFFTLASSAYFPASVKKFPVAISAGAPAAAANVQVTISTAGALTLSAGPTGAGYNFVLDGIRYPLDY